MVALCGYSYTHSMLTVANHTWDCTAQLPFYVAIRNNDIPTQRRFISSGMPLNQLCDTKKILLEEDHSTNSPLLALAGFSHIDTVKLFLEMPNILIDQQNEVGATALMMAASWGRTDIAVLLIERGANVHLREIDGQTALDLAMASDLYRRDRFETSLAMIQAVIKRNEKDRPPENKAPGFFSRSMASLTTYYQYYDYCILNTSQLSDLCKFITIKFPISFLSKR